MTHTQSCQGRRTCGLIKAIMARHKNGPYLLARNSVPTRFNLRWVRGMGEFYRALDTRLDRTVVVKIAPRSSAPRCSMERSIRMQPRCCFALLIAAAYISMSMSPETSFQRRARWSSQLWHVATSNGKLEWRAQKILGRGGSSGCGDCRERRPWRNRTHDDRMGGDLFASYWRQKRQLYGLNAQRMGAPWINHRAREGKRRHRHARARGLTRHGLPGAVAAWPHAE